MNGLFFYIGLGIGLAAACGLRPFLPVLLAGALGSANVLGVDFPAGSYHFLESSWWLLIVAVTFALAWAVQLLCGLLWLMLRRSSRTGEKYAGLRILGR